MKSKNPVFHHFVIPVAGTLLLWISTMLTGACEIAVPLSSELVFRCEQDQQCFGEQRCSSQGLCVSQDAALLGEDTGTVIDASHADQHVLDTENLDRLSLDLSQTEDSSLVGDLGPSEHAGVDVVQDLDAGFVDVLVEAGGEDSTILGGDASVDDSGIQDAAVSDSTILEGDASVDDSGIQDAAVADSTILGGDASLDDSGIQDAAVADLTVIVDAAVVDAAQGFGFQPSNNIISDANLCSEVSQTLVLDSSSTLNIDTNSGLCLVDGNATDYSSSLVSQGGYSGAPQIRVFVFRSVEIWGGVSVQGSRALAVVACEDFVLGGKIMAGASGRLAGPGGFAGGTPGANGQGYENGAGSTGQSSGNPNHIYTGGGGGAFAGSGGQGGDGPNEVNGGAGGSANGGEDLVPLVGGSGGGGGATSGGGPGGAGGGALQLVAGQGFFLNTGALVLVGGGAGQKPVNQARGGGGGGAGGAILIEAHHVELLGGLFANGGSGAGGDQYNTQAIPDSETGTDGPAAYAYAPGGIGEGTSGNGGDGAGVTQAQGSPGVEASHSTGGGGGGGGRIRVNSADDAVNWPSQSISPDLEQCRTWGRLGAW